MTDHKENYNRRSLDRRSRRRPPLKYLILGGRRTSTRRDSDKKNFIFVDRYNCWLLVVIVLLIMLSLADAFFTLYLMEHGATEINPIMAYFLNLGPLPFIFAKYFLTCAGILCLLVLHNFYFKPLGLHVKSIFPAFIVIFLVIMGWQIYLNYIKNGF
jgi:Domain of unknown function (DUF5658)